MGDIHRSADMRHHASSALARLVAVLEVSLDVLLFGRTPMGSCSQQPENLSAGAKVVKTELRAVRDDAVCLTTKDGALMAVPKRCLTKANYKPLFNWSMSTICRAWHG